MFDWFRSLIFGCLLFGFAVGPAFAQDSLTLEHCIDLALEHNLNVKRSQLRTAHEAVNYRQTKQNLLPSLGAGVSHSYSAGRPLNPVTNEYETRSFMSGSPNLSSQLLLFDGLAMFRNITQQAFAYRATQLDEQLLREQTALDVTSAYIQALTARDVAIQIDSQLAVTRQHLERSTLLHAEGAISPGSYYDIKGEYADNLNSLNNARNAFNDNLINLFKLLNLPFDPDVKLTSLQGLPLSADVNTDDALYQAAAERLSFIRAADHWTKSAEFGVKASRSGFFPRLSMGAGLSSNYAKGGEGTYYDQIQNNLIRSLGFSLEIPLFSRFTVRNNVSRAKLNLLDAEYTADARRNELQQATSQALFNLEAAKERYHNLVDQVAHYTESFRVAEVRFNTGAINSVEFLIVKNKVDNANASLVIARYQWHLRQRIVDYFNGELHVPQADQ